MEGRTRHYAMRTTPILTIRLDKYESELVESELLGV
jgi:hypothetical protein